MKSPPNELLELRNGDLVLWHSIAILILTNSAWKVV